MGVYEQGKTGTATSNYKTVGWANLPGRTVENYVKIKLSLLDSEALSRYLFSWPQDVCDQRPSTTAHLQIKSRLNWSSFGEVLSFRHQCVEHRRPQPCASTQVIFPAPQNCTNEHAVSSAGPLERLPRIVFKRSQIWHPPPSGIISWKLNSSVYFHVHNCHGFLSRLPCAKFVRKVLFIPQSDDMPRPSHKASSPQSGIWCFLFQFPVPSSFLKVIQ